METGNVEVIVFRGKDISGSKPGQLPTSSVEMKLGKDSVGTKVVENNRNPQWNTVHTFNKVSVVSEKTVLELTLRDKKDKFAGRVSIPLAPYLNKVNPKDRRVEKWFPILGKKLEEDPQITGEIQVKLRYTTQQEEQEKVDAKERAKERAKEKVVEDQANARNTLLEGRRPMPIKKNPFGETDNNGAIDDVVDQQTQEVIAQTDRVRGESKATTTRTLQKLGEAQEIAAVTSEKLAHQGDQLNKITDDSYRIEDNTKFSARQIRGIKSILGAAANLFSRSPPQTKRRKDKEIAASKSDEAADSKRGPGDQQQQMLSGQDASGKGKYADDDIDRDIDQMALGINNLKNIATEMGKEINSQTKTIDKLMDQTDRNDGIIRKLNMRIAK